MKHVIFIFLIASLCACTQARNKPEACSETCSIKDIVCKLTAPELQARKATVIASLKKEMLETKVTEEGVSFRFPASDTMFDQLTEFIKTERQCCSFFQFGLRVKSEDQSIWLDLSGPEGTKDFIQHELNWL